MEPKIHYKSPAEADYGSLRLVAREIFSDTFAHLYGPIPFAAFLDETYGAGGKMERDLVARQK
jgi:diamine N-acetyltransferase